MPSQASSAASAAERAAALQLQQDRRELLCSSIGLGVKIGLLLVSGVSVVRLAGAYQERLDRHHELTAILQVQDGRLQRAQERFDSLFSIGGERVVMQEQDQWIHPNRLRVLWTGNDATP
ncbi:hypothetical protein EVJ50_02870 [Synechococcus sp. RSCCF101]|uniref:hypothetical protein n=1 Tax=Synechococcus sp. RSCCF101 TaxID=2511069 RepID=UPI00124917BA|nr:hypothetical protein [Synechococcus sp. RSCCF101]QEY31349.1 hypothetical protein EVJ50_02870 [Synechococcus sp. RSCCF101]